MILWGMFTRQRQRRELWSRRQHLVPRLPSIHAARRSQRTVDLHLAVAHNLLDLSLLLQVLQAPPGEGAVDLEPVDEDGDRHEAVGLDILVELVGSGLVKEDGVLGLVLDCFARRKS